MIFILTSVSMSGYRRPLLFPKHLVFPPSSSWHQKPFFGSNLQIQKVGGFKRAGQELRCDRGVYGSGMEAEDFRQME